ncbi:MAG: hypothetical protein KDD02_26580 [Phaeodactylibacter sp.]|nr:hypothetical protein [Phaeodactylibacter sp.]MCB9302660.1 hypothetical protein [Lewinellaceae bacterium]
MASSSCLHPIATYESETRRYRLLCNGQPQHQVSSFSGWEDLEMDELPFGAREHFLEVLEARSDTELNPA